MSSVDEDGRRDRTGAFSRVFVVKSRRHGIAQSRQRLSQIRILSRVGIASLLVLQHSVDKLEEGRAVASNMLRRVFVDLGELTQVDRGEGVFELSIEEQQHVDGNERVLEMKRQSEDDDSHWRDERSEEEGDERSVLQLRILQNLGAEGGTHRFDVRLEGFPRVHFQERAADQTQRRLADICERLEKVR